MLVISDGNDTSSDISVGLLRTRIRESEVLVYALGVDAVARTTTRAPRTPAARPWSGSDPTTVSVADPRTRAAADSPNRHRRRRCTPDQYARGTRQRRRAAAADRRHGRANGDRSRLRGAGRRHRAPGRRAEQAVLPGLFLNRAEGRTLAQHPRGRAGPEADRPRTARLRRLVDCLIQSSEFSNVRNRREPEPQSRSRRYRWRVCVHVLHRARAEPHGRPGRPARRLGPPARARLHPSALVPWLVSYAVGALLGASMLAILPQTLEQLPPMHVLGTLLGGHSPVLRAREAGAVAPLPHARLRGARRLGGPGARRRRVPQLRGRRRDRRGGDDVGAARRQHGRGGGRARDPAGTGRLRHPAALGLFAAPRHAAQRAVGRGQRGRAPWRRYRPSTSCRGCCRTSSRSPRPASSTSRWPI